MGRPSLKDQRRLDLIRACIQSIHEDGPEGASLARIAGRANLTAGIVGHYFADKAELMEATMRFLGRELGRETAQRLSAAATPRERVLAVIDANLSPEQFRPDTSAVWLAFWGRVNHSPRLGHLQRINTARLHSNLRHALRQALPGQDDAVRRITLGLSTLIDGLWLRAALDNGGIDPAETRALAAHYLSTALREAEAEERPAVAQERAPNSDRESVHD
ncbi:transcriptional regulator BetI [Roseospira marina]|uniref:HTH-type transcriptional regulator BetI n=1 Tax=Roseospira marina TaxID=140057 RepID=A0A5M6IDE7_9PROT|nr:transcriptional regulator BetI [Roseospira marina]KAA5605779.1 transcriptional regulator BetI [Roseospira marina]MBB4313590.1 transcriptional repressor BetI [Roseospira marina]MBB5086752.1 transcriptional repressor BetI [Roseospira marina]